MTTLMVLIMLSDQVLLGCIRIERAFKCNGWLNLYEMIFHWKVPICMEKHGFSENSKIMIKNHYSWIKDCILTNEKLVYALWENSTEIVQKTKTSRIAQNYVLKLTEEKLGAITSTNYRGLQNFGQIRTYIQDLDTIQSKNVYCLLCVYFVFFSKNR